MYYSWNYNRNIYFRSAWNYNYYHYYKHVNYEQNWFLISFTRLPGKPWVSLTRWHSSSQVQGAVERVESSSSWFSQVSNTLRTNASLSSLHSRCSFLTTESSPSSSVARSLLAVAPRLVISKMISSLLPSFFRATSKSLSVGLCFPTNKEMMWHGDNFLAYVVSGAHELRKEVSNY